MKLTISRSIWLRGTEDSYLLHPENGQRCCVGIYLEALGMPDDTLRSQASAAALTQQREVNNRTVTDLTPLPKSARWLVTQHGSHTEAASDLYETNDYPGSDESDREAEIARLFAQQGIAVEFTD